MCTTQFMLVPFTYTEDIREQHIDVPHLGGPYIPGVEGVGPAVQQVVHQQPPELFGEFVYSIDPLYTRHRLAPSSSLPLPDASM